MNIQHSSSTALWYTPPWLLDMVKDVLGPIDLDPASDPDANKIVGAKAILTEQQDGLHFSWPTVDSIFLNPPGNKLGNKSMSGLFWKTLIEEKEKGTFGHAIYVGFSLEQLQTTQKYGNSSIGDYPFCIPKKRISFVRPDGTKGKAPSHSNIIVYVPGRFNLTSQFEEVFSKLGIVINI